MLYHLFERSHHDIVIQLNYLVRVAQVDILRYREIGLVVYIVSIIFARWQNDEVTTVFRVGVRLTYGLMCIQIFPFDSGDNRFAVCVFELACNSSYRRRTQPLRQIECIDITFGGYALL